MEVFVSKGCNDVVQAEKPTFIKTLCLIEPDSCFLPLLKSLDWMPVPVCLGGSQGWSEMNLLLRHVDEQLMLVNIY